MPADPELDRLFAALRAARTPDDTQRLERAIWQRWMQPGDARAAGLLARGSQALGRGEHQVALAAFDALVAHAPDFAEGWNKRATLHWLMGNHAASLRDIERTLALEPRHFGALSGLALVHEAQGRVFEALDALERVAQIHPQLSGLARRIEALQRGLAQAT